MTSEGGGLPGGGGGGGAGDCGGVGVENPGESENMGVSEHGVLDWVDESTPGNRTSDTT